MSIAQAKQATAKSAADVFGHLEPKALDMLEKFLDPSMVYVEPAMALKALEFVLDKLYGKTPEAASGSEPKWMHIMRKAIQVDGVAVQDLPGMKEALSNGQATAVEEDIVIEFNWDEAP